VKLVRLTITSLMIAAAGPALLACGPDSSPENRTDAPGTSGSNEPTAGTPSVSSTTPDQQGTSGTGGTQQEEVMRIEITIGDQRFQATLDNSAASQDLIDQLPVTLEMRDHGSVEKTGRLPAPLSLQGQPAGADPDVGDVGYYSPGNDLVFYYGDQSYYNGIVVLGQMDGGVAESIADMEGDVTATVRALDA
jgi:hypothetical protein